MRSAVAQLICSSSLPKLGGVPVAGRLPRVSRPEGGSCRRAWFDRSAGERPRHCRPASRTVRLVSPGPRPVWLEHGTVASWARKPNGAPRMNGPAPTTKGNWPSCSATRGSDRPLPQRRDRRLCRGGDDPPLPRCRRRTVEVLLCPRRRHPRRVHRQPPGPHDYRRTGHRLMATRHTRATPMITTVRRSPGASAEAATADRARLRRRWRLWTGDATQLLHEAA